MKYYGKIMGENRLTIPAFGMRQQKLKKGDIVEFDVIRKVKKKPVMPKVKRVALRLKKKKR
jgi:hypothetical protein